MIRLIGDFLAVSSLIYRISTQLKRNPESAVDYQDLLIELESLNRALKQLQSLTPAHHEAHRLETVRALAITCIIPMEHFLARISEFEASLGPWCASNHRFRGFTQRIQWATMYKDDVELLRTRLAPKVATITMLLLTCMTSSLASAEIKRDKISQEVASKLFGQQILIREMKTTTRSILNAQANLETGQNHVISELKAHRQTKSLLVSKMNDILQHNKILDQRLDSQDRILEQVGDDTGALNQQANSIGAAVVDSQQKTDSTTKSILRQTVDILTLVTAGLAKLDQIRNLIEQTKNLVMKFTIDMQTTVRKLLHEFWDIQRRLAVIERLLPMRIDLPVIRFRDAFNEMRSLPFDLSREWRIFRRLVAVIFIDKQGSHRVDMGQYFVTHVGIGKRLKPAFWSNAIKPGDELSMTMILDDVETEEGFCPFQSCRASLENVPVEKEGKVCPDCHRFSTLSQDGAAPGQTLAAWGRSFWRKQYCATHGPQFRREDIELYCSVQVRSATKNDFDGLLLRSLRENLLRDTIEQAMKDKLEQAMALSAQHVGDEIEQAKRGLENSGKAV